MHDNNLVHGRGQRRQRLAITHGSGWSSSPADIDGTYQLDAISCPTSFLCEAVDNDGNDLTFNGTVWSNPEHIDYSRTIEGISCPTTSFCAAVDNLGGVLESQPDTVISQLTWGSVSGGLPSILSDSANDYIYGPNGTPVEAVALSTGAPTFLTYNPSDGTWISANAAGDETGFWGYDAYGSLLFGTPTSSFGYGGQYLDAATGLSDMRARYYDPATGEFMSVDPDVSQTDRPYAYAGDDPVNESDPTGRSTLGICGELSIVLGGGYGFNGCAFLGQRGRFGQINSVSVSETNVLSIGVQAGASLNVGFQVSTAANPHDLTGWFYQVQVAADFGPGGSIDVFWGTDSSGHLVIGGTIGVGVGLQLGVSFAWTYTWVQEYHFGDAEAAAVGAASLFIQWPSQQEQDQVIAMARTTFNKYGEGRASFCDSRQPDTWNA